MSPISTSVSISSQNTLSDFSELMNSLSLDNTLKEHFEPSRYNKRRVDLWNRIGYIRFT